MASSLLEKDNIGKNVNMSGNSPSLKKKSKRRQSSSLKLNDNELKKQEIFKEECYPVKSAMMSSDEEDITEEQLREDEIELENFDYFKVFKIPLMLFILSFISVLFVSIFGEEYIRNEKTNGIYMIDANYGSYIWNFSGFSAEKQIDKVRIEDIQVAIQMLLMYVDNNLNQTKLALGGLESRLSKSIAESRDTLKDLSNQIDEVEREFSYRTDYLEKMISESRLKNI
ncbi:uncharacterized protein cubi_02434 [Cryptosporidium ubiquitum]|uniref:Uncharacterized protein n=1 Tax=Cryptosporidium ubiquitum TaxID=857276 RepID=A0A1J4MG16_9CRYT|nr:uncharacterized protein cubi_02434 [Cryptosporidium ubiquitum]OII73202.1 hypothetical protein cubi_02434 [Cryptosporidium ubiquitum]